MESKKLLLKITLHMEVFTGHILYQVWDVYALDKDDWCRNGFLSAPKTSRLPWTHSLLTGNWPSPPNSHPESLNSRQRGRITKSKMIKERKSSQVIKVEDHASHKERMPAGKREMDFMVSFALYHVPEDAMCRLNTAQKPPAEGTSRNRNIACPLHTKPSTFPKPHQGPAEDSLAFCDARYAEWRVSCDLLLPTPTPRHL